VQEASTTSLSRLAPIDRLAKLLAERDRLLKAIERRKMDLARAQAVGREVATRMFRDVFPLLEKYDAIGRVVWALFDALLADKSRSRRARKVISEIRAELIDAGVLDRLRHSATPESAPMPAIGDDKAPDEETEPSSGAEVDSAHPQGAAPGRDSLRSMFRRLALLMHPGRAAHDADRDLRTHFMKEATQAYQDGDLARMVDLESSWKRTMPDEALGADAAPLDDVERRCAVLDRMIEELREQLRSINRELKGLRRALPPPNMPLEILVEETQEELAALEHIRAFVADFKEGRITLEQFKMGPPMPDASSEEDLWIEDEELLSMSDALIRDLTDMFAHLPRTNPPKRKSRKKKKRRR
jgi:hypothetical protein